MFSPVLVKRICRGILMVPLFASLLLLNGCFENKAQSGAGLGALGGGLIGSLAGSSKNKEQSALLGALIGGLLGYTVGNEMDKDDRIKINEALETNKSHQRTEWVNPDTGNEYAVTPSPVQQVDGQDCREAEIESVIDGKSEKVVRLACRRQDGKWEI
jgi:surface antigen